MALHQFAVFVFNLDLRLHQGDIDSVVNWTMPRSPGSMLADVPPRPTLFNHSFYLDHDVYPQGLADVVGYWAEDRIIGGVVLFDRFAEKAASASGSTPPNIWLHANREKLTFRPFQLCDDQQHRLVDFLLAETPPAAAAEQCPLPILGDAQNRVRVDFLTAITRRGIFRDIWERKPPTREEFRFWGRRPKSELDYPENRDLLVQFNKMPHSRDAAGNDYAGEDR